LPEEHRTALTLRYLEGLDYRAIEQTMGLSNGALRGILGRALGTLRRMPALATERTRS
jgi:DNA-directed RNA polymerase specialized sigma24 family protein